MILSYGHWFVFLSLERLLEGRAKSMDLELKHGIVCACTCVCICAWCTHAHAPVHLCVHTCVCVYGVLHCVWYAVFLCVHVWCVSLCVLVLLLIIFFKISIILFYALHQGFSFITLLLCSAPNPPNLILMFPQPPPRVFQFPFFLSSTITLSYLAFVYVTNPFEHMMEIVKGQMHTHGWREREAWEETWEDTVGSRRAAWE